MKRLLLFATLLFAGGSANAELIQCSDPSLFQYFATYDEAAANCPRYENVYVTYDYGFKAYTCGCTNPDQGGSN